MSDDSACPDCYIAGSISAFREQHERDMQELARLRAALPVSEEPRREEPRREEPEHLVWRIEVFEDGGQFAAEFISADRKTAGMGNYSATPIGALAELCATLIKIAEDESIERRASPSQKEPMSAQQDCGHSKQYEWRPTVGHSDTITNGPPFCARCRMERLTKQAIAISTMLSDAGIGPMPLEEAVRRVLNERAASSSPVVGADQQLDEARAELIEWNSQLLERAEAAEARVVDLEQQLAEARPTPPRDKP
jgi:hypothetical protein